MRRESNKSIRVSNRRKTEMEEEKQHEAAGQPGTEALAEEQAAPEVSVASPAGEESAPAQAGDAPQAESTALLEGKTPEPVLAGPAEASTPQDEAPSSDSGDEIAEDVLSEEAGSAEPDDELLEDATQPDGRSSDSEGGADSDDGFDLQADESSPETSINAYELIGSTEDQATEADTDAATLKAVLEAIVYVLPEPVPAAQMAAALNQPVERVESILRELMDDTARPDRGVFIREVAGGYQVATKPEHHEAIRNFVKNLKQPLKLSGAALETLAVIAYKQPVTAPEIMEIRGVQGVGVLKTLLDRKLITTAGRKNVIGKPILYKTTKEFLTQFGLNRISELPTLKEFEEIRRQSISDDEIEERPEAHPSASLLEQAAAIDRTDDDASGEEHSAGTPSGETPEETQEHAAEPPDESGAPPESMLEPEPHAEADPDPEIEAEPQSEAPPTPESGPESQENHG
jgi:segregation and condensation protein B